MAETHVRRTRRASEACPEIAIFSGSAGLPAQPVTLYRIELIAGDTADATIAITAGTADEPLISLHAPAGGVKRFIPAAPAFIRETLRIDVTGADAVGAIAFR